MSFKPSPQIFCFVLAAFLVQDIIIAALDARQANKAKIHSPVHVSLLRAPVTSPMPHVAKSPKNTQDDKSKTLRP
jgi:hypothetical protein